MSKYKTQKMLGRGRAGTVYLCEDNSYAIKIYCTQDREKNLFDSTNEQKQLSWRNHEIEYRNLCTLKGHSKIIDIKDTGTTERGEPYILMNFIPGQTLEEALRQGKFSPARAYLVLEEVCQALEYCHQKGLIHRDVTTKNMMIQNEKVTLIDFDQAMTQAEANSEVKLIGKTHYFAPEYVARIHAIQHKQKPNKISTKIDMYALGVSIYRILSGSVPFGVSRKYENSSQAKQRYDLATKRLTQEPVPITSRVNGIPENLAQITMRLLARRPKERFSNWGELLKEIRKGKKKDLGIMAGM